MSVVGRLARGESPHVRVLVSPPLGSARPPQDRAVRGLTEYQSIPTIANRLSRTPQVEERAGGHDLDHAAAQGGVTATPFARTSPAERMKLPANGLASLALNLGGRYLLMVEAASSC